LIQSFRDSWLEPFFKDDTHSKKIPSNINNQLFRKLQLLDDAESKKDLLTPPGNHFEQLSGHLAGKNSIRVNIQWRLIFIWNESNRAATNIYLDKHEHR